MTRCRSCETINTPQLNSFFASIIKSYNSTCPLTSTPWVGSSRMSNFGRLANACAKRTRCSSPPDS